jgi:Peptidase S46
MKPVVYRTLVLGALCFLLPLASRAEEGMWPYNRLPLDHLKQKYDFTPDAAFLQRLQEASVRLNNGGSGTFVSPNGLVMTNHHVASDCIKQLSSEKKDYIQDGFFAARRSAELKCPDLELNVLMAIETVTEQVNRSVTPQMSDADRLEAQRSATARIEKDCQDSTLMRCDVVNLYNGGIFDLYKYARYTDVRLVFAPEFQAAFFGGNTDNFTYPRYCLDVSFLRVYKNDKPVESPAFLPLSTAGASEDDFVLVSGHPGHTNRLLTLAQLRFERDRRISFLLDWLNGMAQALRAYGRGGGEAGRLSRDELLRIDNSIKAYTGMLGGLRNDALLDQKKEQEDKLRAAVDNNPEWKRQFAGAWEKIAAAQEVKNLIYEEYRLIDSLGFYSRYFTFAKHLYELSVELKKPDGERFPEYHDAALESLYQQLYSPAPVYPSVELVKLARSLRILRDRLGPDHPVVKAALKGQNPDRAADRLINGSKLADPEFRKTLGADQSKLAATSNDPMIELMRAIDEPWRALRKRYEDEVEAVENAQGALVSRARFAVRGTDVYPDATFTLRLAFGQVKGYREAGRWITPFTNYKGLFEKATGEDPYVLPEAFVKAKKRIQLDTPYDMVSTNDITGGNSGSPLISRQGQVVGLIFDGNIQSLSNDFLYSEEQARAVSVDARGIYEALRDIYRATALVSELTVASKSSD